MGLNVRVAVLPADDDRLSHDVRAVGGEIVPPSDADALLWTDSDDPEGLREVLRSSPARWVQLPFAGVERFFEAQILDHTHVWTCAKGIYGSTTAEHALALILAVGRRIPHHAKAGTWLPQGKERRLKGSVVLIVGAGGIGRALTKMLEVLEARVIVVNRSGKSLPGAEQTFEIGELPRLISRADFVVLAAPLTDQTQGLLGGELLALMKPDAWVVNVARGGLIDTDALVSALRSGSIGGAALDVTEPEPLPDEHPLWSMKDVVITPHVANTWEMGLPEFRALVRRNLVKWASGGEMEGRIDPDLGY